MGAIIGALGGKVNPPKEGNSARGLPLKQMWLCHFA
jgi:hypothetical protein